MNPWTALLESLHSALIDELCERHPEPKPELGLPKRLPRLDSPDPAITSLFVCDASFPIGAPGVAVLAIAPGCRKALKLEPPALWAAMLKRAGSEFMRRGIRPKLGAGFELAAPFALPEGSAVPGRVVWIPFRLPAGPCFLGVGV